MTDQSYLFDNAWREGRERLDAVEQFLDPGSIRALEQTGVAGGWRCLEAGAGGGSIAAWLGRRAGAHGKVVATDIDVRHLSEGAKAANVEIRRHDIVADPLEEGVYDLVHARLLLEHLPAREAALGKLAKALRPGGWLVVEAVDYVSSIPVSEFGAEEHARSQALRLRHFEAAGAQTDLGRHLPRMMREAGLVEVAGEGRFMLMEGGSPGARWFRLSMAQLRGKLVGPGKLSDAEIDRMLEIFDDPRWSALSPTIFACRGRAA